MAKNAKKKGKSARNGNRPAPYTKYEKSPFQYDSGYRDNYLKGGVLFRKGKPHYRTNDKAKVANIVQQAAE